LGVAFIAVPGRQGVTLGMDFSRAGEVAPGFCQINANWCYQLMLFTDYIMANQLSKIIYIYKYYIAILFDLHIDNCP
jgi:hypothetical protein